MSKRIYLSGGGFAVVDDDDFARVSSRRWRRRWDNRADANVGGKLMLMHRFIMNAPSHLHVDHINGKPLDNRKSNLRLVIPHRNTLNQVGKPKQRVCRYKGVTKKAGMFVATIGNKLINRNYHIGSFATERQAAIAYDITAAKFHKEYARYNIHDVTDAEIAEVNSIINSPKANIRKATSKYIGVGWHKISQRWRARIGQRVIGSYKTEIEAVMAYNKEAEKCNRPLNIV